MNITDYITGTVIQGLGNGHKFGFPTANVEPDMPVMLEKGAYAAWVRYDGKRHKGMLYVGTRPTLDLHELIYEIHIIDAKPNLYGKRIAFKPVYKIAEEKRFKNETELVNALCKYKEKVKHILSPFYSHHFTVTKTHLKDIMEIIGQAKRRMKEQGLDQWQDGYPSEAAILNDIKHKQGHFFIKKLEPAAYAAIVFDKDPYYEKIDGRWLSDGEPYVVVHRLAVADEFLGLDLAKHILKFAERKARAKGVRWFRIDTHHDNLPMRNLIRDFGFTLCGVVRVRDGKRMAYEKRVPEK
ncbi:MAG: GNAT family N-acetyltransferase [Bacteroidales bacterium]|nr:GNAT family N-acetyltransferase [Bacteroidales bacterium]